VPHKHLEDEHANSPVINGLVVALAKQQFRGKVLGRTAHGERAVWDSFAKAKVQDPDVALAEQ